MCSSSQYLAADYQRSLKASITIGRGLHCALQVVMTLIPAEANSGYAFMGREVPFVGLVNKVALRPQIARIQAIIIDTLLTVLEHHKHIGLVTADEFSADTSIDFDGPVIGRQSMDITVNEEVFSQHQAPARTPGADSGIAAGWLKIF
jgi:UDP-3-O-acyl-N-acetylglucosamine deacetylase